MAAKNLADAAKPAAKKVNRPRAPRLSLDSRVRFEELVSGISTEFINLAPGDLDKGIEEVLKKIGNSAGVDHSAVFLFKNGRGSDTHEWCAPGIPSIKEKLQSIPFESYPWFVSKLRRGENVFIRRVQDLPHEAGAERELLLSLGVKSLVSIPMVLHNSLVGFLGFDSVRRERTWPERTLSLFKIVGEIFVNALERKRSESEIQDRRDQLIRHQAALLELAKMNFSDLKSSFQRTTEIAARTLDVDRVSIWLYNPGHTEITCQDLFIRPESRHDLGMRLKAEDYPRYFKALEDSRAITADQALPDPRTSEFADPYLKPLDIVSMLDVPIRRQGQVIGILCHEHTARERKWTLEEQHFAISVGDAITLSLEASEGERTEQVNASIFQISAAANSAQTLQSLFQSIHRVISGLMPAKNFYISLYDAAPGILSFPYFVDEYDAPPEPKPLGRGLTEYVLRTGQALLASPDVFADLERRGEVESVGAPSIDWLGVPLNIDGQTIGVMVVQGYTESLRYTEEHKSILKFVCDQVAMVIHRKKTEEEVQERERFLSSMFESIQDGISILGEDYTILRVNKAMEKWYAHALPVIGKKCYEAYHLRDRACDICPTRKTIKTSEAAYEVVPKVGPGGEVTGWLDLFSFPLIDKKTGQMKGVIEYVRDITERKKAEDRLQESLREKEVLLREIHHRVKNNMQVISSLLNLQSRRINDSAVLDMFRESQRRIRSMALIHERLYQSSDLSRIEFSEYLRNLATHLFHSYQVDASRVQLRIEAEEVDLNINTAIPCGLMVNELVSNALKHGFPEGRSGRLQIDLHRVEGDGYTLRVTDDGVGFPKGLDFRKTETLGMQIVNTLASQIDASIDLDQEEGTRFTIHFQEVQYRQRT